MKRVVGLAVMALLVGWAAQVSVAHAQTSPIRVFGAVTVDGQRAAPGARVAAIINGQECGSGEVRASSTYSFDVLHESVQPGCGSDGAIITFTVDGAPAAEQATFRSAMFTQVDLHVDDQSRNAAATTPDPPPTGQPEPSTASTQAPPASPPLTAAAPLSLEYLRAAVLRLPDLEPGFTTENEGRFGTGPVGYSIRFLRRTPSIDSLSAVLVDSAAGTPEQQAAAFVGAFRSESGSPTFQETRIDSVTGVSGGVTYIIAFILSGTPVSGTVFAWQRGDVVAVIAGLTSGRTTYVDLPGKQDAKLASTPREQMASNPSAQAPPAEVPAVSLTGRGQTATQSITLPSPVSIARFSHSGRSNFIVRVLQNGRTDLLINKIGSYSGTRPLTGDAPVVFDIQADGDWSVTISPILLAATPAFSGSGDEVSGLFDPPAAGPWEFTHTGSRNFIVWAHCAGGNSLVQNKIGAVNASGVVTFRRGPCFWEVEADGSWSLTPR